MENSLGKDDDIVDVVSTSNMFQVGIDIGRLGLMGIVGQPKSNSEYIQSSGRVGRKHPGLVISYLKATILETNHTMNILEHSIKRFTHMLTRQVSRLFPQEHLIEHFHQQ